MKEIARLLEESGLADAAPRRVAEEKGRGTGSPSLEANGRRIYRRSLRVHEGVLYFIAFDGKAKRLFAASRSKRPQGLHGTAASVGGLNLLSAELSAENVTVLHERFPFTAPISLRQRRTTIGCGDRLGLATPGHVRAMVGKDAAPVLAQQSVRELTLTRRDFPGVVRDASFLVFQEGYEDGYGADGDHLKTLRDIDLALDAGMPMITLDLTEVMSPEPAAWPADRVEGVFGHLPADFRRRIEKEYEGRGFQLPGCRVEISALEAQRCAIMYARAIDFAAEVDRHLRTRRGSAYDLEVSIDETTAPTLPAHHLFIATELGRLGVAVTSMAPRFVGEFQKGIDYIGRLDEFEEQFKVHCAIAKARGGYKISVHSGSDKFSVYPAVGRHTDLRLHLKTAGTSWLQAVRVIARLDPSLFRVMLARALEGFPVAAKLYHVAANPAAVAPPSTVSDERLESYLDLPDSARCCISPMASCWMTPRSAHACTRRWSSTKRRTMRRCRTTSAGTCSSWGCPAAEESHEQLQADHRAGKKCGARPVRRGAGGGRHTPGSPGASVRGWLLQARARRAARGNRGHRARTFRGDEGLAVRRGRRGGGCRR